MTHKTWYGCGKFVCIYPGLKLWMERNEWNVYRLAYETGLHPSTLAQNLNGKAEMKMYTIRKVLETTGLTFEQAFGEMISTEKARKER